MTDPNAAALPDAIDRENGICRCGHSTARHFREGQTGRRGCYATRDSKGNRCVCRAFIADRKAKVSRG